MTTPLKIYTDSHIPKAVADQLRAKGVDIVRCQEVGMADADDLPHLEYATGEGRVVVTGDRDFLGLNAEWQAAGREHAGIVFVKPETTRHSRKVGILVSELSFFHEAVEGGAATVERDFRNQVRYI
jgi:predicted nuclease of predicted toxin-antitoxin system